MKREVTAPGETRIDGVLPARPRKTQACVHPSQTDAPEPQLASELLNFVKALARDLARADADNLRRSKASTSRKEAECQQTTISVIRPDRRDRL
jgi:hypothetical protein